METRWLYLGQIKGQYLLSTKHGAGSTTVQSRKFELWIIYFLLIIILRYSSVLKVKPVAIVDYNGHMLGVDQMGQLVSLQLCPPNSQMVAEGFLPDVGGDNSQCINRLQTRGNKEWHSTHCSSGILASLDRCIVPTSPYNTSYLYWASCFTIPGMFATCEPLSDQAQGLCSMQQLRSWWYASSHTI